MNQLVLSTFSGADLLGMAFEQEGFCVVSAGDIMFGHDIKRFHPIPGRFNGLIGGPPCQKHSTASEIRGTEAEDLIPEFVRVWKEGEFDWCVMENVPGAIDHPAIPGEWWMSQLRDWDCGGATSRVRCFWTYPMRGPYLMRRDGQPEKSVMATTWKRGKSYSQYVTDKGFLPGDLPVEEYGRLQGCEDLAALMRDHKSKMSRSFIVHVLGNGVPLPMGRTIARAVKAALTESREA